MHGERRLPLSRTPLFVLSGLLLGANLYCAEIHVRVIDARAARPKPRVDLKVYVNRGPKLRVNRPERSFSVQTDQSGIASFEVDPRTEQQLAVYIQNGGCSPPENYDVLVLLREGVVGKNQCSHTDARINDVHPGSGEIIIFWERIGFWEALTRPDLWP